MFCSKCGKELPGGSVFCPFCGEKQAAAAQVSDHSTSADAGTAVPGNEDTSPYTKPVNTSPIKKARYNLLCILGLVISCISLVFNYFGLVGLGGIIVSVLGVVQCNRNRENGRILGVLGIFFGAVSVITAVMAMM